MGPFVDSVLTRVNVTVVDSPGGAGGRAFSWAEMEASIDESTDMTEKEEGEEEGEEAERKRERVREGCLLQDLAQDRLVKGGDSEEHF